MRSFVILVILKAPPLEKHCLRICKAENDFMGTNEAKNHLEMLTWQIAMGADEAVGDEPVDWFSRSADQMAAKSVPVEPTRVEQPRAEQPKAEQSLPAHSKPAPPRTASYSPVLSGAAKPLTVSHDEVGDARKLANACQSLDELIAALETFEACPLSRTATNLCFIDGNRDAKILMIGEAPGRDEDLQGKPFVGRSGQLLDKMLNAIDLSRHNGEPENSVLISNTVFWRPPGNRKPTEAETLMCLPFVNKLIELTDPKMIICLGATPTQRLTGETKGITRLRGRWFSFNSLINPSQTGSKRPPVPLLATLHPSYLLRQPAQKRLAWRDFIALKLKLKSVI